ncbi:mannose/fructose/N-acetylgalactosamine-specific phosphotransferase system component IID [Oceanotoga teriensis]|uniref:Mannose/fructose/N-acetylgalactosamine-specific phosphotransferase system component IID n=1 Tax=Oceanotoga teriensis TaxID=515440 RepID=A0AA45HI50_9BACT|nr:PTS system mannose/fructose/sorbose family transporter subunit IID [Oceanotoga teriensis]PWJ89011.1 mannose/fructose/N-acetylgalactosamine-specific phosphotransferase system component IID [Oceanotoga teriensis]
MNNKNFKKKLSKKDLFKSWWSWIHFNLAAISFERLEGTSFGQSMLLIINKLYDTKEEKAKALKRHTGFYNTEPQIGAIVNGITVGLEEAKANDQPVEDELIEGVKVGLMGPIAGVGDVIIQGILVPLLLSIGMGLAADGSILGPLFYTVTWLPLSLFVSYFLFKKGYTLGLDAVNIIVGEEAKRLTEAFKILGIVVMGGISASFVKLNISAVFDNGKAVINFQELIDGIFPKLLPLLIVLLSWKLLQKKSITPLKLMGIYLLLSIVGVFLGIF